MVTTYEILSKLTKSPLLPSLLKTGLVDYTYIAWKCIYEYYTVEKARGIIISEAGTYTAEEYRKSENTIYRIIKIMESKV